MRVLVVDDTHFMRRIIRGVVEMLGFEVCGEAADGFEAVHKYEELNPDLVILDVVMPEKNGLDALLEIKNYDQNSKVIICSAMGQEAYVNQAVRNGAMDFVVKPFEHSVLKETILRVEEMVY